MIQDVVDNYSESELTAMEFAAHMGLEHLKHNLKKSDVKTMTSQEFIDFIKLVCMNYDEKRLMVNSGQDINDFIPF